MIVLMPYSPEQSKHWQRLAQLAESAPSLSIQALCQDPARLKGYSTELDGLYADYTRHLVTDEILTELRALAQEAGVASLYQAMLAGQHINTSEDRPVRHTAMRAAFADLPAGLAPSLEAQREQMIKVSAALREGSWRGATGQAMTDLVVLGMGGSALGPQMVCAALPEHCHPDLRLHFIANVDGAELRRLLSRLAPQRTLIIVSSKSFSTAETLRNAASSLKWLAQGLGIDKPEATSHVLAITANQGKALAYGLAASQILTFDEGVGGRYSLWSASGLPIAIAIGYDSYAAMLEGARCMDRHFLAAGIESLPASLALLGVWYNNFLGAQTQAVVPYCERLGLLVDYLQQLSMESNGKSASRQGEAVQVATGPVLWGQTGTSGQHAFFQLLHQGTQKVPVDFIGLSQDASSLPEHHREMNANLIAQADALAVGRASDSAHRHYSGNRPSTVLMLDALTPRTLGLLVALYEHIVFVQGALWQINSFDQWGVELGKELASALLEGQAKTSPATSELLRRTGLDRPG